jgi:hypothetical protein
VDRQQGPRPRPQPGEEGGKSEVGHRSWLALFDEIREPNYGAAITERVESLLWVLDHLDDLDADFLAIYGIDLEQADVSARRYFALAQRLPAYQGVMAARYEEAREEQQAPSSTSTRTSSEPAPRREDVTEVSLTQFRAQFPGLVSVAQGG